MTAGDDQASLHTPDRPRFGAHCYLFTERWSDASLDLLDQVRALGAESFEIAVGDDVEFNPALTRRRAEELGLQLTTGPGGLWPMECDLSADDAGQRQRGLAWHKQQVDLSAACGAMAYTGALYGHPGRRPAAHPTTRRARAHRRGAARAGRIRRGARRADSTRADEPFPDAPGEHPRASDAPRRD